jgi:hypothetical protein
LKEQTLYRWAKKKLGPSKCKRIRFCKRKGDWYGEWDWEGTITLNLKKIQSTGTLYRTLAHEWTHAQQMWREYKKWDRRVPYKKNPLEIEARKRERELWKIGKIS